LRKFSRLGRRGIGGRKTVTFGDAAEVTTSKTWMVVSLGGLLVLWWYITRGSEPILDKKTFPSPAVILDAFVEWWQDGYRRTTAWEHASASLSRVLKGMVIGTVIGIPVGFAMGLSRVLRGIFDPIVELFRPIPPLALLPPFIMWFGIGEASKVNLLVWASVWVMIIASRSGVLGVSGSKVHAAYSLGANKWQILRYVIMPNALPEVFTGVRVALGVSWGTLVAAELVGAEKGLGTTIYIASRFFRMDIVFVNIIIIGVIGASMEMIMRFLEARLIPWRGKG
jgi:taurine transport system permease protein|tara:strand:+ start:74 stop:919 length:846 start_codon:yes stop_codon:yes gene_type:complete